MDYEFIYRYLAETLYQALTEDAFYITLEKSVAEGSAREAMIRYMDYSMVEAAQYGKLLISSDRKSGAAIWSRPLPEENEIKKNRRKREFLRLQMGNASLECYDAMVSAMADTSLPQVDPQSWYLSIIGIHPRHQSKGLGIGLIEPVLQQTDRMQHPTFLETFTPRSIPFYERLGYEVADRIHEPTSKADYWLMVREPQDS
jgi:GNAT superfamily N-acetyltransferase